jgi:hypothetical protein
MVCRWALFSRSPPCFFFLGSFHSCMTSILFLSPTSFLCVDLVNDGIRICTARRAVRSLTRRSLYVFRFFFSFQQSIISRHVCITDAPRDTSAVRIEIGVVLDGKQYEVVEQEEFGLSRRIESYHGIEGSRVWNHFNGYQLN